MFPSVMALMASKENAVIWIPINAPVILAVSTLAGYLILQLLGGGGPLTGLAFGGFFSLMSIGTLCGVATLLGVVRSRLGIANQNPSTTTLILVFATSIIAALIASFFICNAISSLSRMTSAQGFALAGLTIGMFGVVNLIAYCCKRGYTETATYPATPAVASAASRQSSSATSAGARTSASPRIYGGPRFKLGDPPQANREETVSYVRRTQQGQDYIPPDG